MVRHQAILKSREEAVRRAEARRLEASQRKEEQLSRLRTHLAEEEQKKRERVLTRKTRRGADVLSVRGFLGEQSDNVWELLGKERSSCRPDDDDFTVGGIVDLYALEKKQMRADAAFLDKLIHFDADGKVQVRLDDEADRLELQRMVRGNDYFENLSADTSSEQNLSAKDNESMGAGSKGSSNPHQYKSFLLGRAS